MDLDVASLADDPHRRDLLDQLDGFWPAFMSEDPTGAFFYAYHTEVYPQFVLVGVDRASGRPVAKAYAVPVSFPGDPTAGLSDDGWDWAMRRAAHDRLAGRTPDLLCAVEIMVRPDARGRGLSGRMLAAMRDGAARHGFADLVAPVRPSGKHTDPGTPIDGYARAVRADGLPVDPWLRVHVRAGGRIVNVAHHSMVIAGTLDRWRKWTGLPFDRPGPVLVPQALSPVHCDPAQDHAVYVEPNVWVHHRLRG